MQEEPRLYADGAPGRGLLWFQLYVQHERGFTRELVQRADRSGYEALVLTVDSPVSGARDRERRAGFQLPPGVSAVNLAGLPQPPAGALERGQSALFDGLLRDELEIAMALTGCSGLDDTGPHVLWDGGGALADLPRR